MGCKGLFFRILLINMAIAAGIFQPAPQLRAEPDEMIGFDEMQRQKQIQIQEFERQESAYRSEHPDTSMAQPIIETNSVKEGSEKYQFHFDGTVISPEQLKEAEDQIQNAEKIMKSAEERSMKNSKYSNAQNSGYLHQLSRALPCFKEFISLLYQARYARDSQLVMCQDQSCQNQSVQKNLNETETITARFYSCLKFDPSLEASLNSKK